MISSIIMAGVVIALSFSVLAWAQFRTSDYTKTYGETTDAEIARLKERLTVEYIFYNNTTAETINIYLLNYGAIDVNITSVSIAYAQDGDPEYFSDLELFLDGTPSPETILPTEKEGYIDIECDILTEGKYFVSIFTERGSIFDSEFEA